MKLKAGVLLFIILFSLAIVIAQDDLTTEEKARSCLENKLGDNCANSDSVEQLAFSLLAMSHDSDIKTDCKSALLEQQEEDNSFGTIKEISLAILALDYIGQNTNEEEDFLLTKKRAADLEWYLEIDSDEQTSCTLNTGSITIDEDKKISGTPGNCFSPAYDSYWLKISDNCLEQNLTVSCDKEFISTLIYKKPNSAVWHISSDIQSASGGGQTKHQIDSYCFGINSCDYEGTLWAVLVLQTVGEDISPYTSYLTALSEDNEKYFPYTFLYILTGEEEYLNKILLSQKTQGYWKLNINEYYDTALALLALTEPQVEDRAEQWLDENQGNDGCWHNTNIRDTSLILWAQWPETPSPNGITRDECEDFDYYCIYNDECLDAGGNKLDNFWCPSPKICCDRQALEETCSDLGGIICPSEQVCATTTVSTFDTNKCCLATCISAVTETECEEQGYDCRTDCFSDEEETTLYDCEAGEKCCKEKISPPPTPTPSRWWIYVLIILIILVILGILFRNKLRSLFFKRKLKKGPVFKTRPGFPSIIPKPLRQIARPTRRPVVDLSLP